MPIHPYLLPRRWRQSLCVISLLWLGVVPAAAQDVPVNRFLNVGDPMPTGPGLVNAISTPTVDAGQLAYGVVSDQAYSVVVLQSVAGGATTTVVDNQTTMPNSTPPFWQFSLPRVRNGLAMLYGRDYPLSEQGLYYGLGGPLGVLADRATTPFTGFSSYSFAFDGLNAAFYATNPAGGLFLGQIGSSVYRTIVRGNDPLPGDPVARINQIHVPSLRGGWLVFSVRVYDTVTFQYAYAVLRYDLASSTLSTVVGRQTPVPGLGGPFTVIEGATTDGSSVVFAGRQGNPLFGGWSGLCRLRNGTLSVIADNSASLPGSTQLPPLFGAANSGWLANGDDVAFCCGDGVHGQTILYARWRGRLVRIAERGDQLGSGTLDNLYFSPDGFDGRYVTFVARYGIGLPYSLCVADLACANVEVYGNGCAPAGPPPQLRSSGCPAPGQQFALESSGNLGTVALAVIGTGRTQVPLLGCDLLVAPILSSRLVPLQGGTVTIGFGTLPSWLSGFRLTAQVLSLAPATSALATTNGLDVTIY
ncbi:MAG: hypothetical protein KDC98_07575 [Planctomycetes bacterium]|nr:hypothetical protein [Planctomycetota bacterium]